MGRGKGDSRENREGRYWASKSTPGKHSKWTQPQDQSGSDESEWTQSKWTQGSVAERDEGQNEHVPEWLEDPLGHEERMEMKGPGKGNPSNAAGPAPSKTIEEETQERYEKMVEAERQHRQMDETYCTGKSSGPHRNPAQRAQKSNKVRHDWTISLHQTTGSGQITYDGNHLGKRSRNRSQTECGKAATTDRGTSLFILREIPG